MSRPFSLVVTDTSPLFTLVLGDGSDSLLRLRMPVRIPGAVCVGSRKP